MLIGFIIRLVDLYSMLIFIYVLLSWVPMGSGVVADVRNILGKLCDPYLDLFRKLIPPIGGMIDITPIIALVVLQLALRLLVMIF